tara:strand:+ start:128622 stop:130670 length:2049 start_codon:yes stop_codon:yes gene_type:complete
MARKGVKEVDVTSGKKGKKKSFAQDSFAILENLDGVRANPSMYLGELGEEMARRHLKEKVDNSYDEHVAGRNNLIEVVLDYDNDLMVVADGAGGIPTDFKKLKSGEKITIMTAALTKTHAGGKFNDKAYKTSAGTHGVGVAAANAVSEEMRVWSTYNGGLAFQRFERGEIATKGPHPVKVKKVDSDVTALLSHKKIQKYGTIIASKLDQTVVSESSRRGRKLPKNFVKAEPDAKKVAEWLKYMANLNPGLVIKLSVVRKGKTKGATFHNKKDLAWIPKTMCDSRELKPMGKPFTHKSDHISLAVVWSDHPDSDNFVSFVNTSPTADGGWHVKGFTDALVQAVKPYMPKAKGKGKGRSLGFKGSDLLVGLTGLFDYRMHGAAYTSQVKDKLASKVDREVYEELLPAFEEYFSKNKKVARDIIKRAQAVGKGREDLAAVVKSMADVKKKTKGSALPGELAVADKAKPHERELFIVEGDSAAGTAIDARNSDYQEVLPAGGKPLNALKAPLSKVLGHAEIQKMLTALGADVKTLDPKAENPTLDTGKLRTANVILLVDPDPDGGHIAVLYLAAIYRLLPDLYKEGRVWCIDAPLYAAVKDGELYGGMTFDACRKESPKKVKDGEIVRIKGWGEVDETFLEPIAFKPSTRRLIRINPFESAEKERFFRGVVAENAMYRRQLLGLED